MFNFKYNEFRSHINLLCKSLTELFLVIVFDQLEMSFLCYYK